MKLIVISHSGSIDNETSIVTKLFEAGLETYHLRKHKLSAKKTKEFLKAIPSQYHNRIILHTHHKLAGQFKLKGIHLTKSHRQRRFRTAFNLFLIRMRNPSVILTTSFNNIGSLLEKQTHNYSYIFLSPIFDNLTSKFQGGFTEHSLRSAFDKTEMAVIARGGIDADAIEKAARIGFRGLAFYSCIWKSGDPLKNFNQVIEKFQELNIKIE